MNVVNVPCLAVIMLGVPSTGLLTVNVELIRLYVRVSVLCVMFTLTVCPVIRLTCASPPCLCEFTPICKLINVVYTYFFPYSNWLQRSLYYSKNFTDFPRSHFPLNIEIHLYCYSINK